VTIYGARRKQALFGCLMSFVFAVAAYSHHAHGLAIFLIVLGLGGGAFAARRPRLKADEDGLTVANLVCTVRIPWSDIAGFGLEWSGAVMGRCLAVERRDGTHVKVLVVTDSPRSGYSSRRVQEIVAELRRRLVAAGGSLAADQPEDTFGSSREPRRRRGLRVYYAVTWLVLCVFLVTFGSYVAWNSAVKLPHTYAALRTNGIHATADFAGCSVIDIRTTECRLSLRYQGRTRTWDYQNDYAQFNHLAVGAPVDVLIDPNNPTTVYTVRDVVTHDNAGFGVLSAFGVVMALLGMTGAAWYFWSQRRLDAKIRYLTSLSGRRRAFVSPPH
jgi:Bacterial PH domain/Protein of unknown function (DUF3592)